MNVNTNHINIPAEPISPATANKVSIRFGWGKLSSRDIAKIEVGSVIELDSKVSDDVEIVVDGKVLASGQAVLVKSGKHAQDVEQIGVAIHELVKSTAACSYATQKAGMSRIRMIAALAILAVSAMATSALAQSAPANDIDAQPVVSVTDTQRVGDGAPGPTKFNLAETAQTVGALAIVIALIYASRYLLRRLGKSHGVAADSDLIEVLSRTSIGPKNQLVLVRLGSRLVLIGCWADGMARLSEITDADEVATLTASTEAASTASLKNMFRSKKPVASTAGSRSGAAELAEKIRERLAQKDN